MVDVGMASARRRGGVAGAGRSFLIQGEAPAAPGAVPRSGRAGSGTWSLLRLSRAHFVEREREPVGAIAVSPCDMPAQLANESFRADHVRFGNSVGAVVQVLMRSYIPAAEAFFRDHLRASPIGQKFRRPTAVGWKKTSRASSSATDWGVIININEGTGPSAVILNQFATELDHCIVRECEVSRGRKNAAGTQTH